MGKTKNSLQRGWKKNWQLWVMILPAILFIAIFCYGPMYGIQLAFRDFNFQKGLTGGDWAGLKYFQQYFQSPMFWPTIRNTFLLAVTSIVFGFPIPILLALVINQIKNNKCKKLVQTTIYMPYFISTVVLVALMNILCSPTTGLISHALQALHLIGPDANILGDPGKFIPLYVLSGIWQSSGWNSIIYIAALSSVDTQLYDAAKIDGANRWQLVRYVELPAIAPTIIILLIMNMGNILSVGFEKTFLMQNSLNKGISEVISTYVFNVGIKSSQFSFGAAVGLFNTMVNFIVLMVVNGIARKKIRYQFDVRREWIIMHTKQTKRLKWKEKTVSDKLFEITVIFIAVLAFATVAYPLYFIIIASISDSTMVNMGKVLLLPKKINFYGYEQIFGDSRIWKGYLNTIVYSIGGTVVNMLITLPAAYVLSRTSFKPRKVIMPLFVFTMYFSGGMIPTYLMVKTLHLIDTPWAMILPTAMSVYNLIIARTFMETSIPEDLYEAARLDGCSHFRYFSTIVLPLSKAVISVLFLYYMVAHWNDFFTALLYLNKDYLQPLQMVLRNILLSNQAFQGGGGSVAGAGSYAQQYADQIKFGVIIVSTIPILCIYPFIQKYFEKGVMIGAVKG